MISRLAGLAAVACLAGALSVASGCADDPSAGIGIVPPADAAPAAESGADAGSAADSGTDTGPSTGCTGACKAVALTATFGGKTRFITRAQFGTQTGDSGAQLHVEAHSGGEPACPTAASPTPTYTLIVSSVPRSAPGGKASKSDGVTSAFFDFAGDLGLPALTKATAVVVSALQEDTASPPAWTAFDVTATFAEGSVTGHVYAEYCASLTE